jgi:predicted phosphodiesterase
VRYLILSDIHANWESLEAALEHATGKYDQVLCCGDLVGYGADPNAVTDWVRTHAVAVVRGNHDKAAVGLDDLEWFNPVARAAAVWTHRELTPENAAYIRNLPRGPLALEGFQLVHGSPLDEDEYVLNAADAGLVFGYLETPLTFFGHTHLQGGFIWNHARVEIIGKTPAEDVRQSLELDAECAYMINPGSVGQPRDNDPRAAYVVYNPEERFLSYYRLPYDVRKAQDKIRRAGLPVVLADRLAAGK